MDKLLPRGAEISAMKRLSHRHLVRIIGSYTDSQCFAFLMEPVAQCNMAEYLQDFTSQQMPSLRKFFGCLSNAITYLHDQKMHHLDIKLQNILVKQDEVFVADFGAAHDFSRQERSTTWSSSPRTARYMPPEISRDPHSPRNYATDVWSLGVVFLEMATVLRGHSLKSFHSYLLTHGTRHQFVYGNQAATHSYFEVLRTKGIGPEHDNEPLSWVKDMINMNAAGRPTARAIRNQILQSSCVEQFRSFCCAGTDQWWEQPPTDLSADLKAGDEALILEDEFFEASEVLESAYALLDPLKTHRIELWLDHSDIAPQPEPDADTADDDGGIPFDIIDDGETVMSSTTKLSAPNRFVGRLADFDFLCSSPSTTYLQTQVVSENIGDELAFDIIDDDANSLSSDITARPPVNALDADGADISQLLNDLDKVSSSPELLNSPSRSTVEPSIHIPTEWISTNEIRSLNPTQSFNLSPQSNLGAPSGGNNEKSSLDKDSKSSSNKASESPLNKNTKSSSEDNSKFLPSENSKSPLDENPKPSPEKNSKSLPDKKKKSPRDNAKALTLENLLALEQPGKSKSSKVPKNQKLGTYAAYMQNVWEVESSQATSVISERTSRILGGNKKFVQWQDNSLDLLPHYASEGKVAAVRKLLECGCNPGTKVSQIGFLLRHVLNGD